MAVQFFGNKLSPSVVMRDSPRKLGNKYFLVCAVIFLAFTYFYQVPNNPPGFYIDEASISYNAYTISHSGHDEYGESWPLYFRAFGEYKNPVYIYVLAILFRVFGPSILVARMFSAALGVLTIGLLTLLAFRISRTTIVACFIGFSAALTPWFFENSRLVFEVALYPPLLLLFFLVLRNALQKERWGVVEAISIAANLILLTYSYSIGRLLAPLFAVGLIIFLTRQRLVSILTAFGLYALSIIPAVFYNSRNAGALTNRFWLLSYITPESSLVQIAGNVFRHYFENINPWTIAVTGENNVRDHVGSVGSILAPTVFLSIAGIFYVVRHLRADHWWRYMLYALIVSPIPASLTVTKFPQIRLIALPIIFHVFMVPAVMWLTNSTFDLPVLSRRYRKAAMLVLILLIITLGTIYRLQFRRAGPERWYIFDEQFPREVLPTALGQTSKPIYFSDPPGKSGYVEAYWYGVLHGMPAEDFVRLPAEVRPPKGAVVISTAEECSDCRLLLKSINYIVYLSGENASIPARQ